MKQYHQLLQDIKEKGTLKSAARENMPGTISLFGYQMRFDLQEGFPLVTTKKISFKNIVVELLWFLKGDTNIKYLVDNGCNIWNEDAYNFYLKIIKERGLSNDKVEPLSFDAFIALIKEGRTSFDETYKLGDCGYQYGKVWRDWQVDTKIFSHHENDSGEEGLGPFTSKEVFKDKENIDQLAILIKGLKTNPQGRRHILTAIDPAHDTELALYWCHCMVQFNCRPLTFEEKIDWAKKNIHPDYFENLYITELAASDKCPKYYLDCQMYQRSADVFLGVPYNIASYALLTEILCKLLNMIPGDYVHTFGDVHIYEDHLDAVNEQLTREPRELPKLNINTEFWQTESGECGIGNLSIDSFLKSLENNDFLRCLLDEDIQLSNYNPHPTIKAKLSTGLKK